MMSSYDAYLAKVAELSDLPESQKTAQDSPLAKLLGVDQEALSRFGKRTFAGQALSSATQLGTGLAARKVLRSDGQHSPISDEQLGQLSEHFSKHTGKEYNVVRSPHIDAPGYLNAGRQAEVGDILGANSRHYHNDKHNLFMNTSEGIAAASHEFGHGAVHPKLTSLAINPKYQKLSAAVSQHLGPIAHPAAQAANALVQLPELASEALASYHAQKGLRAVGMHAEAKKALPKHLAFFGTYLAKTVAPVAAAALAKKFIK